MTFTYSGNSQSEFYIENYNIPSNILDSKDEVLIYINGIFTGLTQRNSDAYQLDKIKGCITIKNSNVLALLNTDPLWNVLKRNDYIYIAWKNKYKKTEYVSNIKNQITLVWR
jgi:hypothetical protein